jgi:hypothetical protein
MLNEPVDAELSPTPNKRVLFSGFIPVGDQQLPPVISFQNAAAASLAQLSNC